MNLRSRTLASQQKRISSARAGLRPEQQLNDSERSASEHLASRSGKKVASMVGLAVGRHKKAALQKEEKKEAKKNRERSGRDERRGKD